jgi:hypothetical protein
MYRTGIGGVDKEWNAWQINTIQFGGVGKAHETRYMPFAAFKDTVPDRSLIFRRTGTEQLLDTRIVSPLQTTR